MRAPPHVRTELSSAAAGEAEGDNDAASRLPDLQNGDAPASSDAGGDTETITRQWAPIEPEQAQRKGAGARGPEPTARVGPGPRPRLMTGRSTLPDVSLEPSSLQTGFEERYEMRELLGRGGMGEVRVCKDLHIGREVAIKVIRTDHTTRPDVARRFEREARVQGQLEHPAIVPVYDFGVAPDGATYITMKRLRGVTFHDIVWLLKNRDPQATALYSRRKLLSAFSRACLAIAFAHSRGVLHRDLKPSNIMLGDFGEVYVLDWGLAKIRRAPELDTGQRIETPQSSEHRTIVGEVVGTPGYMAPEQALGEVDRLDARTDVYALGAILFEILALEPLHKEEAPEDVLLSTLYGADARPSVRAPGRDVPPELDRICVKAVATRPEDRFASVSELCAAVDELLDGESDSENRRAMAEAHAQVAREAVAEAKRGGKNAQAARERAMREAGTALALNPTDREAMRTLVSLLLDDGGEMPPEALREFLATKRGADKESRRALMLAYLSWLAFAPPAIALGVRDWGLAIIAFGFMVLSAITAWASLRGFLHDRLRFAVYVVGVVAMAFSSSLMGWAILLPGMAATHVLAYLLHGDRRTWRAAVALGAGAVVVPCALQISGVTAPSYAFRDGMFFVLPQMTHFPPGGTLAFLLLSSVGLVVAPAVIASRVRGALARAEERLFMHAWMLRHLIPDAARTAAPTPAASTTGVVDRKALAKISADRAAP